MALRTFQPPSRRRLQHLFLGLLVAGLASCPTLTAQQTSAAPRIGIVDHIDEGRLTTLKGNTPPQARTALDRGQVAPDLPMGDLVLVLRRGVEQQAAFDKFVASQYDKTSPNFHQWLSPDEVGERFGPSPVDVNTASTWLLSHGFSVDEVSKDRLSIRFSGRSSQVQNTFHTRIHNLEVKGEQHIANVTDPQIPEALAPVVVGVKGLHNFFPKPLFRLGNRVRFDPATGKWERLTASTATAEVQIPASRPHPLFTTTNVYGDTIEEVTPYDFAAIYNVLPLWQAGTPIDGSGQTIAIAGTSNINLPDIAAFRQAFGLPAKAPTVIITNSDPGRCESLSDSCLGDLIENSLDVEWSGAVAKGANIVLVASSSPTSTTDSLYLSASYIVQHRTANVMNVSYGACELTLGNAGNTQWNNLWQTAASEGIAVFVASGDAGTAACDQGFDASSGVPYAAQFGVSVNGIASTPYDTAVGGTDFNWGATAAPYWSTTNNTTTGASALGYIPEVPWNSTCANSAIFPALAADAAYLGAAPVTDAESACNFILNNAASVLTNTGVHLAGLVDTIGGGGGVSNCTTSNFSDPDTCGAGYAKPSWQTGIVGIPADGKRDVPDVSFFASNGFLGSAYLICVSAGDNACAYSSSSEPTVQEVGGTSAASPAMAGIMALINQKTGASQGNPNSGLYTLASQQTYTACTSESAQASGSCFFNDIDVGSNAMPCANGTLYCGVNVSTDGVGLLNGYNAGTGFDLATGLGSLNVANVVRSWPVVGSGAPIVSLSATSLSFSDSEVGNPTPAQTVTLTNTGTADLTISGITVTGTNASSFSQTNNCGTTVTARNTCTINVVFTPGTTGPLTASVHIADNATGTPQSIALTGTGKNAADPITLTPPSLTFPSTAIGVAAPTQTVTLKNNGTGTLSYSGLIVTGTNASSFSQTNTCSTTMPPGGTCVFTVTFKPTAAGSLAATITLPGSTQSIGLSGTGAGAGATTSFTPTSLTFASTTVGVADPTQAVTLKNTGGSDLSITNIGITGANSASFAQTNTCGTTVAAGASCVITVTFNPAVTGTITASIAVFDNVTGSPQLVGLTGTATGGPATVTLTPPSLTFASTTIGTPDPAQAVTLKNTGGSDLTVTGVTIAGANMASFAQTNNCGTTVIAGASCVITVTFNPTVAGPLSATVNIADSATGSPQSITLTGTATAVPPSITLTPPSLTFASTTIGTADPAQAVTLKNTGGSDLTVTGITVGGTNAASFAQTNTCGTTVIAGASCIITVTFNPTVAGSLSATVNIADNVSGSPQSIALTGTATAVLPSITLTPPSLTFASTTIGTADPTQAVTLKNTGGSDLTVMGITIAGANAASFTQTNTCGTTVTAGTSCIITVTFNPTATGPLAAAVDIADNVTGSPQSIALAGTGTATAPGVTLTPPSLTFASTTVGTADSAQTVTLNNTGGSDLTVTGITIGGTNAASFGQTNTCGAKVTAGASCIITVTFNPTVAGSLSATVNIADSATGSPQSIALTGTGTAAAPSVTLTPPSLTFASTTVGVADVAQTVTLKNTGTGALTITGVTVAGSNAASFLQSNACGNSLAVNASCVITVTFNPTVAGSLSATINIADNAGGSPQQITLAGTATAVVVPAATVSVSANPSVAVVGATVVFNTTVAGNTGTPTGTVTIFDGTNSLGTTNLSGGAASFSSSTLAVGAHSITAKYSGDATFATVTSSVVTVTITAGQPGIVIAAAPTSFTIVRGATGTTLITATPSNSYTGTLTFACGTLPTDASCTFSAPSLTFTPTSTAQSTTLTISTQGTTGHLKSSGGIAGATSTFVALLLLPFLARRRVRDALKCNPALRLTIIALLGTASIAGLSGCGGSYPSFTTPTGSYTITVNATNGTTAAGTLNLQVTVQ